MRWLLVCVVGLTVLFGALVTAARADEQGTSWQVSECSRGRCIPGTWTRRGQTNTWDATWNNGAKAVLTIAMSGNQATVKRSDPSGISAGLTGTYTGTIDGTTVRGTVTWSYRGTFSGTWTATITGATQPAPPAAPTLLVSCSASGDVRMSQLEIEDIVRWGRSLQPPRSVGDIRADIEAVIQGREGNGSFSCSFTGGPVSGSVAPPPPSQPEPPSPPDPPGPVIDTTGCDQLILAMETRQAQISAELGALLFELALGAPDDFNPDDVLTLFLLEQILEIESVAMDHGGRELATEWLRLQDLRRLAEEKKALGQSCP